MRISVRVLALIFLVVVGTAGRLDAAPVPGDLAALASVVHAGAETELTAAGSDPRRQAAVERAEAAFRAIAIRYWRQEPVVPGGTGVAAHRIRADDDVFVDLVWHREADRFVLRVFGGEERGFDLRLTADLAPDGAEALILAGPPRVTIDLGGELAAMRAAPPETVGADANTAAGSSEIAGATSFRSSAEQGSADEPADGESDVARDDGSAGARSGDRARTAGSDTLAEPIQQRRRDAEPQDDAELGWRTPLRLNTHVVTAGETITAEVNVVDVHNYFISITPAVRMAGADATPIRKYVGNPPTDGVNPVSGSFIHEIDTADLPLFPPRAYFEVTLHVLPAGGGDHILVHTERIFVKRELSVLAPSQLRVQSASPYDEVIAEISGPAERARIELVRLGRFLPGGAVTVDHPTHMKLSGWHQPLPRGDVRTIRVPPQIQFYNRGRDGLVNLTGEPMPAGLASHALLGDEDVLRPKRLRDGLGSVWRGGRFSVTSPFSIGHFELRVIGRGDALIGREPIEFRAPEPEASLTLIPDRQEPYSFDSLPTVEITLPADLGQETRQFLRLSVDLLGREDSLKALGALSEVPISQLKPGSARDRWRLPITDLVTAGRYQVRLALDMGSVSYLLDQIAFNVGGTPPPWAPPFEPIGRDLGIGDLGTEDVIVESVPEVAVWQDPFTVTVRDTAGRALGSSDDEDLIATLFYLGHYTHGCAWRQGYYGPSAPIIAGKATLPAPAEPGKYEIHIFRSLSFDGDSQRRTEIVIPTGIRTSLNLQLIGVGTVRGVAPAAPGAIRLSAATLVPTERLEFAVQLPPSGRNPHSYQIELWRAGDEFPGGVLGAPHVADGTIRHPGDGRTSSGTIAIETDVLLTLDPLLWPGDYELRLFDRTTGFHVDRAPFSVRDPGPPALPIDAQYRRDALTDWPTRDDPLRGLEAWLKPADACEDPVFPAPPDLRLAELYSSDPETGEDDEFVPVTHVQPGHPVFVEAAFEQAPPDPHYRVKLNGERKIRVFRTDDPRLYRSKMITFLPNGEVR